MVSQWVNVKSWYHYVYWKVLTPELLELEAFSSYAEVSGYLEYQLHINYNNTNVIITVQN